MRRFGLSLSLAVALSGLAYSAALAQGWPSACAVGLNVHPHARIVLHHRTIANCASGTAGCKCVSCYAWNGSVFSACYPLVTPIPH